MKLFLDTANITEIKEMNDLGVIEGVTTNPTLIANEGRDPMKVYAEISKIIKGHVLAEVIDLETETMIKEGEELSAIAKNIVVKIPMCENGLKAVHYFSGKGIPTTVTLIFSAAQALLAARAGATYVCPFIGRLDDIGQEGIQLLDQIRTIFTQSGDIKTKILAASIRTPNHVIEAASIGVDVATLPTKVLKQMIGHPLTDAGIKKFVEDSKKFKKS
jgi:transaldolase